MQRYTIINSSYRKSTFLLSYESFKQISAIKNNTNYGVIKIRLIWDNYNDIEHINLLKSVTLFLKSQFGKKDFVTCIDKERFLIFMDSVYSTKSIKSKIDFIAGNAQYFFKRSGFVKPFSMRTVYSILDVSGDNIDTFLKNISDAKTNMYPSESIDVLKINKNEYLSFNKLQLLSETSREEIFSQFLEDYFPRGDFFDSVLSILSNSSNLNDVIKYLFSTFEHKIGIDSIYLFTLSDNEKYLINNSIVKDDEIGKQINSISISYITKLMFNHDNNYIMTLNDFSVLPHYIKRRLHLKGIKNLCNRIIFDNRKIVGIMGFLSSDKNKTWSDYDINHLISLSKIVSLFIHFKDFVYISKNTDTISDYILSSMNAVVYAIDDEFNLTYANEQFREIANYKGVRTKCYEILMENEYPCASCPIKNEFGFKNQCCSDVYFKNMPLNETCKREMYYKKLDLYYKVYITKNEHHPKYKYVLTAFNIDKCKKFSSAFEDNRKQTLFNSFDFKLLDFYNSIASVCEDYLIFYNLKTKNTYIPDKLLYELGYSEKSKNLFSESTLYRSIHEKDLSAFKQFIRKMSSGEIEFFDTVIRILNKFGKVIFAKLRASLTYDQNLKPNVVSIMIKLLNKKPVVDYSTNLPNRFHLKNLTEEHLRNKHTPMAILLIEFDNLTNISKIFGRNIADYVVIDLAETFQHIMKDNMMLFLFEWNIFAIKIETADIRECMELVDIIKNILSTYKVLPEKNYYLNISAGCSFFPKDSNSYNTLISNAEYALEQSRLDDKHRLISFSKHILQLKYRKNKLTQIIGDSMSNNFSGFYLVYQSHIDTKTDKLLGAESLARFTCDEFGSVSPEEFIPILEEMGFIQDFGKWVLTESVKVCIHAQKQLKNFHINVNVSYLQLLDDSFIDFLKDILNKYALTPNTLFLELTETSIVKNKNDLIQKFKNIQELGIKVAMDDFGVGSSSLGLLKEIPIDMLKIDKIFVKGINSNKFDATFIQFIGSLCSKANITTCLEGVELESELNSIKIFSDIDMIQGYFYGKPSTYETFANEFLNNKYL